MDKRIRCAPDAKTASGTGLATALPISASNPCCMFSNIYHEAKMAWTSFGGGARDLQQGAPPLPPPPPVPSGRRCDFGTHQGRQSARWGSTAFASCSDRGPATTAYARRQENGGGGGNGLAGTITRAVNDAGVKVN